MTLTDIYEGIASSSATEPEKGRRFEAICRDYLRQTPLYKMRRVWLWSDWPLRGLFSSTGDVGIDLVGELQEGGLVAIQCKCHAPSTAVDLEMMTNFLTVSEEVRQDGEGRAVRFSERMLISTSDLLTTQARERLEALVPSGKMPVRLLTPATFGEDESIDLEALKAGRPALLCPNREPRACQTAAIAAAYQHFVTERHERGTLVMACGTGKTFAALGIAQKLCREGGTILYLVPSIGLLAQSQRAWLSDAPVVTGADGRPSKSLRVLCVCSDETSSATDDQWREEKPLGATTDEQELAKRLLAAHDGLLGGMNVVVFATYQSLDVVIAAQKRLREYRSADGRQLPPVVWKYNLVICDEAHRTAGTALCDEGQRSEFVKVHDNSLLVAERRLYMTATPKVYSPGAVTRQREAAALGQANYELCSMDDEARFGRLFYRYSFGDAIAAGVLTPYNVVGLAINEQQLTEADQAEARRLNITPSLMARLKGTLLALDMRLTSLDGTPIPAAAQRASKAIVYCRSIGKKDGSTYESSRQVEKMLPAVATALKAQGSIGMEVQVQHVDGSMNAKMRTDKLTWLKEAGDKTLIPNPQSLIPNVTRCLSNVHCLTEGIDVPALDAVVFLSEKRSTFEIIQAVGRVMRRSPGKERGHIVVPFQMSTADAEALDQDDLRGFLQIVGALKSIDKNFDDELNRASLDRRWPQNLVIATLPTSKKTPPEGEGTSATVPFSFRDLELPIQAVVLDSVGAGVYWRSWAGKVGQLARRYVEHIGALVANDANVRQAFEAFLAALQDSINGGIDATQAIELLAQHAITLPVFTALFPDYNLSRNQVSKSMELMAGVLNQHGGFDRETGAELDKFFEWVRDKVNGLTEQSSKQTIIKNLYENFFAVAFPEVVQKLGIVYTPVECVDFILRSADDILRRHFGGRRLSDPGVHILDPFAGTGTFLTRLLQDPKLLPDDRLLDKYAGAPNDNSTGYHGELHCNEIVLLAYYIADVNIESAFNSRFSLLPSPSTLHPYVDYDGICLTDTFAITEHHVSNRLPFEGEWLRENRAELRHQRQTPITVIVGNPPYSVGQRSANDNAQNYYYPHLNQRIASTYAARSGATSNKALYDSYFRAFRWASDRIIGDRTWEVPNPGGGLIGFISNGAWLDSNSGAGFRRTLVAEFDHIYVVNLRGNQRTSGELSRREGGKIFGSGSRTPITITFLVREQGLSGQETEAELDSARKPAVIHYVCVAPYQKREAKLAWLNAQRSALNPNGAWQWQTITPNDKGDWIDQRHSDFDELLPLTPEQKFVESEAVFNAYANGTVTSRDAWVYNYSGSKLLGNVQNLIAVYNEQVDLHRAGQPVTLDPKRISWSSSLNNYMLRGLKATYDPEALRCAAYRPFNKTILYTGNLLIHRPKLIAKLFPTPQTTNRVLCVSGPPSNKPFSCLMVDNLPDFDSLAHTQCFPLYYYEAKTDAWGKPTGEYTRYSGISTWMQRQIQSSTSVLAPQPIDVLHYVYAVLHSRWYRERYAEELRRELPRIPKPTSTEMWLEYVRAGEELADLHLHYEQAAPYEGIREVAQGDASQPDFYRVERLRFGRLAKPREGLRSLAATTDPTTIIVNDHLTLTGIPQRAEEYVVNGKSALAWVVERYSLAIDPKSGITNDPNDWGAEHQNPRYIVDLIKRVTTVSLKTLDIIEGLGIRNRD